MPSRSFGSQFWVAVFFGSQFFFTEFWVAVLPATLYVLTLENCGSFYFSVFGRSFGSEFGKTARFLPEFGIVGSFGCELALFWVRVSKFAAVLVPSFWFLSAVSNQTADKKIKNENCRQF